MKNVMKIAAVAAMMLVSANVNAQEKVYGPEAHDFGVEVQFNPFSNNFETFKIDGLQLRYFINAKNALRLNLSIGASNTKGWTPSAGINSLEQKVREDFPEGTDGGNAYSKYMDAYDHVKKNYKKNSNFNFGLSLGYENHFAKVGRLDMYAGAELGFVMDNWKSNTETAASYDSKETSASWKTLKSSVKGLGDDKDGEEHYSSFAFGANIFTGVDFYITKNLYVGAEIGLNIATSKNKDIESTSETMDGKGVVTSKTVKEEVKNSAFNLGFAAKPALRLGWTF